MFGLSPEEIEAVGVPVSMGVLMLYMGFIVWNLAKESKPARSVPSCCSSCSPSA